MSNLIQNSSQMIMAIIGFILMILFAVEIVVTATVRTWRTIKEILR